MSELWLKIKVNSLKGSVSMHFDINTMDEMRDLYIALSTALKIESTSPLD